jgi:hypothetical protein
LGAMIEGGETRELDLLALRLLTLYRLFDLGGRAGGGLEQRGFDALWAEHSHIPASRRAPTPGAGELAKRYYDVMGLVVTLTAAAAATKRLKVGIGVCLVIQRDTI